MFDNRKITRSNPVFASTIFATVLGAVFLSACASPRAASPRAATLNQSVAYQDAPLGYADSEVKPGYHIAAAHRADDPYYQFDAGGFPVVIPAETYMVTPHDASNPQTVALYTQPNPRTRQRQAPTLSYADVSLSDVDPSRAVRRTAYAVRPASTRNNYIVKDGDTVYGLSKAYCSSISDIARANGLRQDFKIYAGQSLAIPRTQC